MNKRKNKQQRTPGVVCGCVQEKVTHERGIPYECDAIATEGVGYAHSSEDTWKGKNRKSEGALLLESFQEGNKVAAMMKLIVQTALEPIQLEKLYNNVKLLSSGEHVL